MTKKLEKPTKAQQKIIDKRLFKKYPHMASEAWINALSKKVRKELKARRETEAQKTVRDMGGSAKSQRQAGTLSAGDAAEIAKHFGKKKR